MQGAGERLRKQSSLLLARVLFLFLVLGGSLVPVFISQPTLLRHDVLQIVRLIVRKSVPQVPVRAALKLALEDNVHTFLQCRQRSTFFQLEEPKFACNFCERRRQLRSLWTGKDWLLRLV